MVEMDALDVIARTRGKVEMDEVPTGGNLFLVWGWPSAVFFLLEFLLWQRFHQLWCLWVWAGLLLVAVPLMVHTVHKDRQRTHTRTRSAKLILDYWMLAGLACCALAFLFGFVGLLRVCLFPIICLLVGIGSFITGEVLRFRPKMTGGLLGCAIGIGSFLLQGEYWHWQILAVSVVSAVTLIIPGYLYNKRIKDGV